MTEVESMGLGKLAGYAGPYISEWYNSIISTGGHYAWITDL